MTPFLTTRRLEFRVWADDDLELAVGLWGDPDVARLIRPTGLLHPSYRIDRGAGG